MTTTVGSTYRNLRLEMRGAVAVLSVHRPDVLNALNRETLGELEDFTRRFVDDPAQGALIVTGSGEKSFISGADIQELAVLDPKGAEEISRFGQRVFDRLEQSPKLVIAAINGYAFGGGCELALACHVRLAAENAVLGLPEVGLGIIPGYGGTQRLPRLVGRGRALELILTGRRIKADEALGIGLVNRVLPHSELLGEAEKLALAVLKNGPLAVTAALEAVFHGAELRLADGQRLESSRFGILAASEDMHEGLQAFLEKRPARFQRR
ncbi:MAG TPA: enoyl-CoA hydratase-related protein [Candidatus Limnocylindria bacterium]|nr:enoyl-CoA hydratase-related protein [Candidatus Limnocylindria bacterium]